MIKIYKKVMKQKKSDYFSGAKRWESKLNSKISNTFIFVSPIVFLKYLHFVQIVVRVLPRVRPVQSSSDRPQSPHPLAHPRRRKNKIQLNYSFVKLALLAHAKLKI